MFDYSFLYNIIFVFSFLLLFDLVQPVLGKLVNRPAKLDKELALELQSLTSEDDAFETHVGRTMCTYDFYEGTQLFTQFYLYDGLTQFVY